MGGRKMIDIAIPTFIWIQAVGTGLMTGIYFAFSTFVMIALSRVDASAGISSMQSINTTILGSMFSPLFFGTSMLCLVLTGFFTFQGKIAGGGLVVVASLIYFIGMFGCTILFNVPLNDFLSTVDPAGVTAERDWHDFLDGWLFWNHVRTFASGAAFILYLSALVRN